MSVDMARERQQRLGDDTPAWILVHDTVGRGGPCTCPRWRECRRPGKHPATVHFPQGLRDAVPLSRVLEYPRVGTRLAAVLGPSERVLDADSVTGMATLWSCWPEVERAWGLSSSPRGVHVWQDTPVAPEQASERVAWFNGAVHGFAGGDVKGGGSPGYVIWPDGRERHWLTRAALAARVSRLFPGVEPGHAVCLGRADTGGGWVQDEESPPDVDRLVSVADWLRRAGEGDRNNSLNWAAWMCRGLVDELGWADVAQPLRSAALAIGLERGEVERTLRSALGNPR